MYATAASAPVSQGQYTPKERKPNCFQGKKKERDDGRHRGTEIERLNFELLPRAGPLQMQIQDKKVLAVRGQD